MQGFRNSTCLNELKELPVHHLFFQNTEADAEMLVTEQLFKDRKKIWNEWNELIR